MAQALSRDSCSNLSKLVATTLWMVKAIEWMNDLSLMSYEKARKVFASYCEVVGTQAVLIAQRRKADYVSWHERKVIRPAALWAWKPRSIDVAEASQGLVFES